MCEGNKKESWNTGKRRKRFDSDAREAPSDIRIQCQPFRFSTVSLEPVWNCFHCSHDLSRCKTVAKTVSSARFTLVSLTLSDLPHTHPCHRFLSDPHSLQPSWLTSCCCAIILLRMRYRLHSHYTQKLFDIEGILISCLGEGDDTCFWILKKVRKINRDVDCSAQEYIKGQLSASQFLCCLISILMFNIYILQLKYLLLDVKSIAHLTSRIIGVSRVKIWGIFSKESLSN